MTKKMVNFLRKYSKYQDKVTYFWMATLLASFLIHNLIF